MIHLLQIIVNGYQGSTYPVPKSERNAFFRPLVAAIVQQVLGREAEFTVHGRNGDLKRNTTTSGDQVC